MAPQDAFTADGLAGAGFTMCRAPCNDHVAIDATRTAFRPARRTSGWSATTTTVPFPAPVTLSSQSFGVTARTDGPGRRQAAIRRARGAGG
ncbi:hypothetical protein V1460_16800 [Streptomyces sp. SCSIO 30461]|uniref:hypothetical protein n=1 Tax=Streptomyces sp. SCSIO 30461 TaxID=3118085 RepID=UPI0030CCBA73